MSQLGPKSVERLAECDQRLQSLFNEVAKGYDCTIICGHRSREDQDEAVRTGKSKLSFPNSKHNLVPSQAADVVPYPIDWNDTKRFYHFIGYVLGVAHQMGIKVRSGSDWNSNMNFKDEHFMDLPHFELVD